MPDPSLSPQGRADQVRAFQAELARLAAEGVLDLGAEERSRVEAHHAALLARLATVDDIDTTRSMRQLSLGLRLATLLGMAALSAAVVLFARQVWGQLPTAAQLGLAMSAPLIPLLLAEVVARRERTLYVASLFAVVAAAGLAVDLGVVHEVLNLPASPHPVLAWGTFTLLLAYRYRVRLLLAAGLAASGWWVAASLFTLSGGWFADLLVIPETVVVPALVVGALPAVLAHRDHPGFSEVYRTLAIVVLGLLAGLISLNGELSFLPFGRRGAEIAYTLGGFALGISALVVGVQRGWVATTHAGTAVTLLLMVAKAIDWWWRLLPAWLFFLLLGGLALLAILGLKRLRLLAAAAT